jgi:hypothetical protein
VDAISQFKRIQNDEEALCIVAAAALSPITTAGATFVPQGFYSRRNISHASALQQGNGALQRHIAMRVKVQSEKWQ